MKKLKPILPSLKEKKRYLAFNVISRHRTYDFQLVSAAISASCHDLIGSLGMAGANMIVPQNCYAANKGIVRVNPSYLNELKSALALVKTIGGNKVIVRSLGVSGMIAKAQKKFIGGR